MWNRKKHFIFPSLVPEAVRLFRPPIPMRACYPVIIGTPEFLFQVYLFQYLTYAQPFRGPIWSTPVYYRDTRARSAWWPDVNCRGGFPRAELVLHPAFFWHGVLSLYSDSFKPNEAWYSDAIAKKLPISKHRAYFTAKIYNILISIIIIWHKAVFRKKRKN